MIFGKLIGGLIGLSAAGFFGAIIGLFAGHFFDKGIAQAMGFDYGADRAKLQRLFFETTFKIMGHLAKVDGRISCLLYTSPCPRERTRSRMPSSA